MVAETAVCAARDCTNEFTPDKYHPGQRFCSKPCGAREYRLNPENRKREWERKRTPEYREYEREYKRTPEYRERARERMRTPEYRERAREREHTPKYRERQRVWWHNQSNEQWRAANHRRRMNELKQRIASQPDRELQYEEDHAEVLAEYGDLIEEVLSGALPRQG